MAENSTKKSVLANTEIESYLKKSIVDIARKCHVYDADVIEVFKKFIK